VMIADGVVENQEYLIADQAAGLGHAVVDTVASSAGIALLCAVEPGELA